jgi:hypothetical protein
MKNVAIVTGSVTNCGIYYYGRAVYDILKTSTENNYFFIECSNQVEFLDQCVLYNIDISVINWHPATMPWYTQTFNESLTIPQFVIIGHEGNSSRVQFKNVDQYISIDVTCSETTTMHPGIRPITYYDEFVYSKPGSKLKIGTSGIGHPTKNLHKIIDLINSQFIEPVELHIHLSIGHFTFFDKSNIINLIETNTKRLNSNIELIFTDKQFSNKEMVQWLNGNDINLYYYDYIPDHIGVSASTDNALASKKPIGVNTSNFFKHIFSDKINLETTSIKDIISFGVEPLQQFYSKWNPETLCLQYDTLVNQYE